LNEAAACGQKTVAELLCNDAAHQAQFTCEFENAHLNAVTRAALGGHWHVVSYLKSRGHDKFNPEITKPIASVVDCGDETAFQTLLEFDFPELEEADFDGLPADINTEASNRRSVYELAMDFAACRNNVLGIKKFMRWARPP